MNKLSIVVLITLLAAGIVGAVYLWSDDDNSLDNEEIIALDSSDTSVIADDTITIEPVTDSSERSWLDLEDLIFELPSDWTQETFSGAEGVKQTTISVPDDTYDVQLMIEITEGSNHDAEQEPVAQLFEAKVYTAACGGAFACYDLVFLDDYERSFVFQIVSDEEPPEDLDGVWSPSTDITRDALINILLTASLPPNK